MAEEVKRWLETKGLVQYFDNFISNGYDDGESVQCLDEEDLDAIGISDTQHREILQGRLPPPPQPTPPKARKEPPPTSTRPKTNSMDMDQFESMLKDIDDMIGDLSSLRTEETVTNGYDTHSDSTASKETSPLPKQPTFELETSDHHDDVSFDLEFNPMAVSEEEEPSFTPVARQQVTSTVIFDDTHNVSAQNDDIDLDSILNDLMAFDPGKAVAEAHMKQQPPITTQSKVVPPVQNGAPPQQTPPVMQTSTSTSTQPPKEQVEETEPSSFTEGEQKVLLTRKLSTYNSLNVTPPDASKAENKTVLIKNTTTISSASDLITDADIQHRLGEFSQKLQSDPSLSHEERELKLKEEKMRIALEKMKLASKKKVIVKVFTEDGASKAVVVDEDMTSAMVCHLLAMKNHADESPQWEMIERIGDLGLERVLEDHENVVDIHTSWPRDNKNVFIFKKNTAKYGLMENPLKFFPRHLGTESKNVTKEKQAERAKKILVSEYFSSSGRVPEIDGVLYMKDGYRKPWKKFYFMLRASGLYQSTKGKSTAPKHLVKFVTFHDHDLYLGINFKKVLHSPSQYCFCLKPTKGPLNPATAKDVKVFCAETAQSLTTWMAGIRMAKYGISLYDDYKRAFLTQFRVEETEAPEKKSSVDSIALSATERMAGSRPPHHNQFATIPESHPPGPTPVPTSSSTQVQASVPTSVPTPIPTPVKPPSSQQHQAVVETQPPTPPPQAQKPPPIAAVPQPTPIQPQARQPPPAPAAVPQPTPIQPLAHQPPPAPAAVPQPTPIQPQARQPPPIPTPYSKSKVPPPLQLEPSSTTSAAPVAPAALLSRPPTSPSHTSTNQITLRTSSTQPQPKVQPPVKPKPKPSPPSERKFQPSDSTSVQTTSSTQQPEFPANTAQQQPPAGGQSPGKFKKPPPPIPARGGSHLSPIKKESPPSVAAKPAPPVKPKPKPAVPKIVPRSQPPQEQTPQHQEMQEQMQTAFAPAKEPPPRAPPKPMAKPLVQSVQGVRVRMGDNQVTSPTGSTPMMSYTDGPGGEEPSHPVPRESAGRKSHESSPAIQPREPARPKVHPYSHDLLARPQMMEMNHSSASHGGQNIAPSSHPVDVQPVRQPPQPLPRQPPPVQPRQPPPTQVHQAPPQQLYQAPSPQVQYPLPPQAYQPPQPQMHQPPLPNVHQIPLAQLKNSSVDERPWFHGRITRDEAQIRIQNAGLQNGVYLVRESTTVSGCFVLTMFAYGVFRNFQIQREHGHSGLDKFFIDDGPQFPSLDLLISHYSSDADRMPCSLTRCAPKPMVF